MGTNKRYPHLAGQRREERELREARAHGPLRSLSPAQLRLDAEPLTIAPDGAALWALAWLQFGDTDIQAVVQVKRWTADAVGVELDVDGDTLRCWLWQGACKRIAKPADGW